jgi:hypothetical protein
MSRGAGNVQRAILDCLSRKWPSLSVVEITCFVYGAELSPDDDPTNSMLASTRRALGKLQQAGLVVRLNLIDDDDHVTFQWALVARRKKEQKKEEEAARAGAKSRQRANDRADERSTLRKRKPSTGVDLIVKILGMLGSSHDGEVLAAARRAEEQRIKLGSSWEQIICGGGD